MRQCARFLKFSLLISFILSTHFSTLAAQDKADNSSLKTSEGLIKQLYDQVTFPIGETPDWDYVRTLFIPQATIVMRTGRNQTSTMSLDEWIADFVDFIRESEVESTGFEERIVKMETIEFGDISHSLVLYTAYIPGKSKAPQEGIDSFHLIKKEGRWWIVSILNEIPGPDRPKPAVLK